MEESARANAVGGGRFGGLRLAREVRNSGVLAPVKPTRSYYEQEKKFHEELGVAEWGQMDEAHPGDNQRP